MIEYLEAFFTGLPVTLLPDQLKFSQYSEPQKSSRKTTKAEAVVPFAGATKSIEIQSTRTGIATSVRVRHLAEHDQYTPYLHQLNLNDLLDHAIAILPEDAYCLLLMVEHDLYEDESDDFCCGRAYGGSRICVVSSAQYQPVLDSWHEVDVKAGHGWPGSHCEDFVNRCCGADESQTSCPSDAQKEERTKIHRSMGNHSRTPSGDTPSDAIVIDSSMIIEDEVFSTTPLQEAVAVHRQMQAKKKFSKSDLASLYLRRVALTASHELLHCFGFDHCVYYACAMQGTASIQEDHRQPPYLCPVCENKLAWALCNIQTRKPHAKSLSSDWWTANEVVDWKVRRNEAIVAFCKHRKHDETGFASLGAWTRRRIELENC